ncbi:hypothetical protein C8Q74DRAFT_1364859 [Fomes fomentarius]|nr:hypothetical protein C8Q74DRAFT_1364859 [Fomes fomentarius]
MAKNPEDTDTYLTVVQTFVSAATTGDQSPLSSSSTEELRLPVDPVDASGQLDLVSGTRTEVPVPSTLSDDDDDDDWFAPRGGPVDATAAKSRQADVTIKANKDKKKPKGGEDDKGKKDKKVTGTPTPPGKT